MGQVEQKYFFGLDNKSSFRYRRITEGTYMQTVKQQTFCGREFTGKDILLIQEVVDTCGGISRRELAHTVCELLEWKRPNDS
jgi:hypoxanthine-guanine phosphoribosyltransferase